ncbi:S-methyl-5-thioribose kinase [Paenibacillus turpanensis]|uniref:S-methyl-5-thioribose kinase n=1 Tax=Paenibacillus turpanensis TaxID=2689078 RepID=UPI00140DE477|nr:S-methyl-5-thioribose kinase [Paenibacillus turpanensis]
MAEYRPLTEQQAIETARTIEHLFTPGAELTCREIGDGNLNLVFHIKEEATGKSVIIKQALPYAKVVGESWPLTLDRARIESEALILQGKLCPDLVPHVYFHDSVQAITAMEDLSGHVIMRQGLMNRTVYPRFAEDIGLFLAKTLFFTSDLGMNQQDKKLQQGRFINPELCKITEDLIFDDPYTNSPNNNYEAHIKDAAEALWTDRELHLEVARLRHRFLTQTQALLHGDLHTGSIFALPDSTKVIDPEFAYYGPMGFDIGAVIANLLLNYAGQEWWSKDEASRAEFRSFLTSSVREVWNVFERHFREYWSTSLVDRISAAPGFVDIYVQEVLQDTVGYAGCKMVRRIVGLSHVADIDKIEDSAVREKAQRLALAIGTSLIKKHRGVQSIEDVLEAVQHVTK